MKVAILAGGKGTRLSEETTIRPKPMVEIGGEPILHHIMRYYAAHGFSEFVIATGYLGEQIVDHFCSRGEVVDGPAGAVRVVGCDDEAWIIDLVDTGTETNTGGRIKRLAPYLSDATFMLTWGDGLADVDLAALTAFHRQHGGHATVTAVHPPARFGRLSLDQERVTAFAEKTVDPDEWINGAFFVLEPAVFGYIEGDSTLWEGAPLEELSRDGQLLAYRHEGFWQCMDTLHEKEMLNKIWSRGDAPWLVKGNH
ncbi:glucose-1-phosphate cytidylyltransferase [Solemya pervernicosa gill symbiont]|uniref:Glucose-1-phosphate cytidylyltransferase n=2 Tax=Gammaproteobacteria incertae sedis TaxID=118884 RepID=A0A1T2L7R5_9GAMM|nr:glucose-1-phosphate cytidylyltransferase [Solemya pervernicosa gill symbiont]QKQ28212.1 glucose-1-phosphate cytidylyltransferase [Candidatus Reidiella endopervernicosa]